MLTKSPEMETVVGFVVAVLTVWLELSKKRSVPLCPSLIIVHICASGIGAAELQIERPAGRRDREDVSCRI